jgi:SAM-dependent methyltransferase
MRGRERRIFAPYRRWVLGGATGTVLEIGSGTGAGFPYYGRRVRLVAAEPDPHMRDRARRRAAPLGRRIHLLGAAAEALPFADGTFDAVVTALTLCSVQDPGRALGEIRRVLKPDGTFRFIEHVRADGWMGRLHDWITPAATALCAGCHPNRRTAADIRAAGFRTTRFEVRTIMGTPLVAGVAVPVSDAPRRPATVVVHGKAECSLCDKATAILERLQGEFEYRLEHVDITRHPELLARYRNRIPVVLLNGVEIASGIVTISALRSALSRLPRV